MAGLYTILYGTMGTNTRAGWALGYWDDGKVLVDGKV